MLQYPDSSSFEQEVKTAHFDFMASKHWSALGIAIAAGTIAFPFPMSFLAIAWDIVNFGPVIDSERLGKTVIAIVAGFAVGLITGFIRESILRNCQAETRGHLVTQLTDGGVMDAVLEKGSEKRFPTLAYIERSCWHFRWKDKVFLFKSRDRIEALHREYGEVCRKLKLDSIPGDHLPAIVIFSGVVVIAMCALLFIKNTRYNPVYFQTNWIIGKGIIISLCLLGAYALPLAACRKWTLWQAICDALDLANERNEKSKVTGSLVDG